MRKNRFLASTVFLLLICLGVFLGCQPTSQPTSEVSPLTSPLSTEESPLPTPTEDSFDVPTPATDSAVVWGQVVDQVTGQAPLDSTVFLGKLTSMDTGTPIVSLHRTDAPGAMLTGDGRFVIADVPPGEYGVVLFTPDISFLVDDGEGGSLLVEVEPGQTLDLGRIEVSIP